MSAVVLRFEWPNPHQPDSVADSDEEPNRAPKRSNFDVEQLRAQSLARQERHLGIDVIREGDARYTSSDGRTHVLCIASQPYENRDSEGYWFGVTPLQVEFLRSAPVAHVALSCGSPDQILWIPCDKFLELIPNMNQTGERHWHIQVFAGDTIRLDQPKAHTKVDVACYFLPLAKA
jgi:hypothetical protein